MMRDELINDAGVLRDDRTRLSFNRLATNLRADSPLSRTRNIPAPGLPPSARAAFLRGAIAGETQRNLGGRITSAANFKKGGRVTQAQAHQGH
jgi:hypothetical protein